MGVLLYALVVGALPFEDENNSALFRKIQVIPEFLQPRSLFSEWEVFQATIFVRQSARFAKPHANCKSGDEDYHEGSHRSSMGEGQLYTTTEVEFHL